jgi:hypothetical protein
MAKDPSSLHNLRVDESDFGWGWIWMLVLFNSETRIERGVGWGWIWMLVLFNSETRIERGARAEAHMQS